MLGIYGFHGTWWSFMDLYWKCHGNMMGYSRNRWKYMKIIYWKIIAGIICWVMKMQNYVGVAI
jgi:hypothetical protein